MKGWFRWRGSQRYGNEFRRRTVNIGILGGGLGASARSAFRAASSSAFPFLRALPFPNSLPLTVGDEYGKRITQGKDRPRQIACQMGL